MKRYLCFLLTFFLLLPVLCVNASAAEPEFRYEITVDGKDTVEASTGDILTVTLHLYRTDEESPYTMYAMQDEIRYDSAFFRLVEDSALLSKGIQSTDISVLGGFREFYMNFLSFSGGEQWQPKTRVGTFQLEVIGTSGVSTITNEDFLVSLKDGSGSYKCDANVLTVILSSECVVKFETNGGSEIDDVTAIYGEKLTRPEDPVRAGKHLVGWYRDIHLTEEWDFENDVVTGHMTLYAKWADGDPAAEGGSCILCGRPALSFLPLCWFHLLILILILLVLVLIYILYRKAKKERKNRKKGKFER